MADGGGLVWRQLRGGVFKKNGTFQPRTNLYSATLDAGSVLVVFGEGVSLVMDTLSGGLDSTGWLGFEGGPRIQGWQCMIVREWLFAPIYPTMTVEEQVSSLAKFKAKGDELASMVDSVLDIFDLSSERKERVGYSEQFDTRRKRILVATRLVLQCPLNILYDPFTDMEYEDARKLMQSLKRYAEETGSVLVVSMEEFVGPQQAKLIELADKVMLTSHGGRVVFHGTLHEASEHFAALGYHADDVISMNHLIHVDMSGPERYMETLRQVISLEESWSIKSQEEPQGEPQLPDVPEGQEDTPSFASSAGQQYVLLVKRFALLFRDIPPLIALFIQSALPILLISFIFFHNSIASDFGLILRSSLFFSLAINNTFALAVPEAMMFRAQYQQVEWEAGKYKLYRAWLVPLARLSVILPLRVTFFVLLTVPLYFITGLRTDNIGHLFVFEAILILNTIVSAIIGILIGAWTPSLEVTQLATVLIIDIFILFGGLGSPGNHPTWIIRWIQFFSPIYYTFRALLRNEVVGRSEVDWAGFLMGVEIERLTVWWAVGGLLLLGSTSLALILLHTTRISSHK